MHQMNEIIYNKIGTNYNTHRTSDQRIVDRINALLNLPRGSIIADMGAGTGNYSNVFANLGYRIYAVEPSREMRRQATPHHRVSWIAGVAESIPLSDCSVDGIMVVLAIHHFKSLKSSTSWIYIANLSKP